MSSVNNDLSTVSILVITYNHAEYIRKALETVLVQDYPGVMEIVVADDCSTDNTVDLIKETLQGQSRFTVRFLESKQNLGITRNYERGFRSCNGEFVAVIEGDDYWTSPSKISRQVEFLRQHLECNGCSVNYFVYEEAKCRFYPRVEPGTGYRLLQSRDLINDNLIGNFSTCMYRASALAALAPKLFSIKAYDWLINIALSRHAMLGFLNEPMSVYRLHQKGTWTQLTATEKLQQQLDAIPIYDGATDYIFEEDFRQLAHRLEQAIAATSLAENFKAGDKPPALVAASPLVRSVPLPIYKILRAVLPEPVRRRIVNRLLK